MKPEYYRGILLLLLLFITATIEKLQAQSSDRNYILTRTYTNESGSTYLDNINYYDGLGRPIEEIRKGITPLGNDLAAYREYDACDRESNKWLPVVIQGNNGSFVNLTTIGNNISGSYPGETKPYSYPVYEPSPLNRVVEQYGPGQAWQNTSHSVKNAYFTNISGNDTLNCICYKVANTGNQTDTLVTVTQSGNYDTAELYVTRTADEDGNASFEFKDKQGRVVLIRKVLYAGGTKTTCDTYYVYDDYGNLTAVLPPLASDGMKSGTSWTNVGSSVLRNNAYLYIYDNRNRCRAKCLPGRKWIYYVYDTADRLIYSQDGEQRSRGEWTFFIPDMFGRVCLNGICKDRLNALSSTSPLQGTVVKAERNNTTGTYKGYTLSGITPVSPTILNVNYYDDYAFMGTNGIPDSTSVDFKYENIDGFGTRYMTSAKTLLTGTLTAELDGSSTPSYLCSVKYYDDRNRPVQEKSVNHLGGYQKTYLAYNFVNQPTQKKQIHSASGKATQTELYTYGYDHAGRLLSVKHKLNSGSEVILAENTYDELGRQATDRHNGQSNLTTTYSYDVRSRMKSSASPLFSQTLYYNDSYAGSSACYNGNLSAMSWQVSGDKARGYTFSYDGLSRLTAAGYLENGTSNTNYSTSYAYDKQGNITALNRRGPTGTTTFGAIDNLSMSYIGSQLVKADDSGASVNLSASMDFKDGSNAAQEYFYDANGNLTKDLNKGISGITYNLLNLPIKLTIANSSGSATNTYMYSAGGQKLKTVQQWSSTNSKQTDYCGNMIYENGILKRILVDGGYIEGGVYYFYLADHEGNNRVVANASGTVVQANHYYPFGMPFTEGNATSSQPYKYNGKELDTERGLNLYDYGARLYDPALARFTSVDPMAEKKPWMSSYFYCSGNPLNRIDPDGRDDYKMDRDGNMTLVKQTDAKNHTIYATNSNGGIDNKNSVQVSKDVLSSKITESVKTRDSNGNLSSAQVEVFTAFGDKQSTDFFEFASKNTDVEWTQVKATVDGAQGYEEVNYIGTSHTDGNDASQSFISSFVPNGVTVREANHDHPNNTTTVSQGDINVATKVQSRFSNATFNIFTPGDSQYTPYNRFSIPGLLNEIIIRPSK